jgi:transcriptional regulator with XRE-family HTH domain
MMMQQCGQTLRTIRLALHLTQEELGLKAGVNVQTIARLENGEAKEVYLSTVVKLARALHVSLDRLTQDMVVW